MYSYAMESLDRLAIALGGDIVVPSCPACLFNFLHVRRLLKGNTRKQPLYLPR